MERKKRNAEGKTSACQITSFISAMFYTIFTKKYTYCVKFYTSWFFLRQVATGHFVDLTTLGIFFNLL
jgi:hypothetical protein